MTRPESKPRLARMSDALERFIPLETAMAMGAARKGGRSLDDNELWQAGQLERDIAAGSSPVPAPAPSDTFFEGESEPPPGVEEPANETKAKPLVEWISTAEIFAPLPPTTWVVKDLQFGPGRTSVISSYSGTGKSLIGQSLAISYAAARSIWGHFSTGRGGKVRYPDFEQGRTATSSRFQRLAFGMGINQADLEDRLQAAIFPPLYLTAADAEDAWLRAADGWDLLIVDTFRAAAPGVEENDSRVRMYIDLLTRVSERTGATFVLMHHNGKGPDDQRKARDKRTKLRGSSAIFDASGCVLSLERAEGGTIQVEQLKQPAEARGPSIESFFLRIEDVATPQDPFAGVRVSYVAREAVKVPTKPGEEFAQLKAKVLDLIRTDSTLTSKNKIQARIKGGRGQVLQAIDELVEEGAAIQLGEKGAYRAV